MNHPTPISSTLALQGLNQDSVAAIKAAILHEVLHRGPGTSVELAGRLGITAYQCSKRTSELHWEGYLERGALITNPSGRKAFALYLTDKGLNEVQK